MQWVKLYRERGLGPMVREYWLRERVSPPETMNTNQVWEWINRSDVAASVALQLLPDLRFLLVVMSAMARAVARFWGGIPTETLQAAELVVYGVDREVWGRAVQLLEGEKTRYLQDSVGRPQTETEWRTWTLSAVCSVANAANLIAQGAPDELARNELAKVAHCSWEGLRRRLMADGMPRESAKAIANAILVEAIRHYVNPQHFGATFTWARQS